MKSYFPQDFFSDFEIMTMQIERNRRSETFFFFFGAMNYFEKNKSRGSNTATYTSTHWLYEASDQNLKHTQNNKWKTKIYNNKTLRKYKTKLNVSK